MLQAQDVHGKAVTVVGTAEVELSLLHVMGQVSGWYNILNTRYVATLPHSHAAVTSQAAFAEGSTLTACSLIKILRCPLRALGSKQLGVLLSVL